MTQAPVEKAPDVAAGLLVGGLSAAERGSVLAEAHDALVRALGASAVWVPGRLAPEVRGAAAYGDALPRYRAAELSPDEETAVAQAWSAVLAGHVPADRQFLRLRVDTPDDVRRLRELGTVNGLQLVPSLDSPGGDRGFEWRWPFRVGVVPGPAAQEWLDAVRTGGYHGTVFDAELYDPAARYEIVLADAPGLAALSADAQAAVAANPCVIVAGDAPSPQLPSDVGPAISPAIGIAFPAHPSRWWNLMFDVMAHDCPVDVAVEVACGITGVDALCSGPLQGLDVTAPMHWFAAVAPAYPDLAGPLAAIARMDWTHEAGGASATSYAVRGAREHGEDPTATVPGTVEGGGGPVEAEGEGWAEAEPPEDEPDAAMPEDDEAAADEPAADDEPEIVQPPDHAQPRRLVARVRDGESLVESVLPPEKELTLLIRVAIPKKGDTSDAQGALRIPEGAGPTVELDVVVSGDVWAQQPPPQRIVMSRDRSEQPSTWAPFTFTTPQEGSVVDIEITLLHQGKPLQGATYVSPVRKRAVDPDERPTLTVHNLSGPDEPTDDLKPVDVVLDGRGVELTRLQGSDGKVLITEVQKILDTIEEQVSRVTANQDAPETLDDPRNVELLITLARIGVDLRRLLDPLALDGAASINIKVNDQTPVLPLELVYAGPAPRRSKTKICSHVDTPPPPGQPCDKASEHVVCPYAFWGLHRSISRTVMWDGPPKPPVVARPSDGFSVLYASTRIADEGSQAPLPGDRVLAAAREAFGSVTRVTSWTAWRKAIRKGRPRLLVVLGHTVVAGTDTSLFIGKNSSLPRVEITSGDLLVPPGPPPLVLLVACSSLSLGDAFGTLPGVLTAEGAGAVVGTLATITGPPGATATVHLLKAFHDAVGSHESVGDSVAAARRSLLAEKRTIGLILVSHGELDAKVAL